MFQSSRPRGARPPTSSPAARSSRRFQSSRPRGARRRDAASSDPPIGFQSSRPRGARPAPATRSTTTAPRFHSRARPSAPPGGLSPPRPGGAPPPPRRRALLRPRRVSILAPAGGATRRPDLADVECDVSILAPAGGATLPWYRIASRWAGFNPRARGGRDAPPRALGRLPRVSILAPAGGATSMYCM